MKMSIDRSRSATVDQPVDIDLDALVGTGSRVAHVQCPAADRHLVGRGDLGRLLRGQAGRASSQGQATYDKSAQETIRRHVTSLLYVRLSLAYMGRPGPGG